MLPNISPEKHFHADIYVTPFPASNKSSFKSKFKGGGMFLPLWDRNLDVVARQQRAVGEFELEHFSLFVLVFAGSWRVGQDIVTGVVGRLCLLERCDRLETWDGVRIMKPHVCTRTFFSLYLSTSLRSLSQVFLRATNGFYSWYIPTDCLFTRPPSPWRIHAETRSSEVSSICALIH